MSDPSGQKVDITSLCGEINVTASIIDPTIVVRVTVIDGRNIFSTIPVKGGADMYIQVSYADTKTKYNLKIAEVANVTDAESQRIYNLIGISKFAYTSASKRISQSYRGAVSSIAAAIYAQYSQEETGLWDQSTGVQTLVIPNWSPIRTLQWLAKRARPADHLVQFRFFQDTMGKYNFMPIERALTIYKKSPVAKYTYFKNVTRKEMGNNNEIPNTAADTFSIEHIEYGDAFNVMEGLKRNFFAGKLVTTDLYTKTYKEQFYDYFNDYNPNNYANPQPMYPRTDNFPSNIMYNTLAYNSSATRGLNENDDISYLIRTRVNDYNQKVQITIKGNSVVDIGQLIEVDIPAPAPKGDTAGKRDQVWSGVYYVVGKRDRYDKQDKTTILELVKESMLAGAPT